MFMWSRGAYALTVMISGRNDHSVSDVGHVLDSFVERITTAVYTQAEVDQAADLLGIVGSVVSLPIRQQLLHATKKACGGALAIAIQDLDAMEDGRPCCSEGPPRGNARYEGAVVGIQVVVRLSSTYQGISEPSSIPALPVGMIGVNARVKYVYVCIQALVYPHVSAISSPAAADALQTPVRWNLLQVELGNRKPSALALALLFVVASGPEAPCTAPSPHDVILLDSEDAIILIDQKKDDVGTE